MSFLVLGHRGMGPTSALPQITTDILPENSIAAFRECLDLGADGIELDVHLTKDGKLAVIHDDELGKKVFCKDRASYPFGLTSHYNLSGLGLLDIGNGHKIPSLEDVLDLIVEKNSDYKNKTGKNLTIDIELKGENTATATYEVISSYINSGKLKTSDFIFNSFHWDRLRELKSFDNSLKIMPAIKTRDLFGKDNVLMPGYKVSPETPYCPKGFQKLADFHAEMDCHAFDCVIFDLRPELVDFCKEQKVGLFTSTSSDFVDAKEIYDPLLLMVEAKRQLPFTGFRADHVLETNQLLSEISAAAYQQPAITTSSQPKYRPCSM